MIFAWPPIGRAKEASDELSIPISEIVSLI